MHQPSMLTDLVFDNSFHWSVHLFIGVMSLKSVLFPKTPKDITLQPITDYSFLETQDSKYCSMTTTSPTSRIYRTDLWILTFTRWKTRR